MTNETRPLRFGALTPLRTDLPAWRDQVRRLADTGYSTILMPDTPEWQPAPGPTLAVAATLADVRVGTWVYASPVRPAWSTAWEAHSLSVLTEGRFEMGLGTGRPGIADQLRELGLPLPDEPRIEQVRTVVRHLRALDGPDLHTPVALVAGGPRSQAAAAELADVVTFVMPHVETRAESADRVRRFGNPRGAELALHVPVVGDAVEEYMAGPDLRPADVRAADSLAYLPADPAAAADEIRRRRDELGFTYFVVGADVAAPLAPVVAELAGT